MWKLPIKPWLLIAGGVLVLLFGAAAIVMTVRSKPDREATASTDAAAVNASTDADADATATATAQLSKLESAQSQLTKQIDKLSESAGSSSDEQMRAAIDQLKQRLDQQNQALTDLRGERAKLLAEQTQNQKQVNELRTELKTRDSALQSMGGTNNRVMPSPDAARTPANKDTLKRVDTGAYYALIIGNSNYRSMKEIDTSANDARVLAELLKERYGFKVKVLLDATIQDINSELQQYTLLLRESDNFLVYYGGHGIVDKGRAYWLGVDADLEKRTGRLGAADIRAKLKQIEAKHILVVSDSSFCEAIKPTAPLFVHQITEQRFMLQAGRRARVVLASGRDAPIPDGDKKNSVFAKSLIQTLRDNENVMSGEMLSYQLLNKMKSGKNNKGPMPVYFALNDANHEFGDFFFVPELMKVAAAGQ